MGENQNSVYKHDRMDKNVSFSGATFEFLCSPPPKKKTWKTILDSPVILCPAIARLQWAHAHAGA